MADEQIISPDLHPDNNDTGDLKIARPKPFIYKMPRHLKYALSIEGSLLFLSVCAYFLFGYFGATYHFDKDNAAEFLKITRDALQKPASATPKQVDSLQSQMAKALSASNYHAVNIDYFFAPNADNTEYKNLMDTTAVNALIRNVKTIPDTGKHRKQSLLSMINGHIDPKSYEKFNLEQFVIAPDFLSTIEDDPIKYFSIIVGIMFLATTSLAYYDLKHQRARYERAVRMQNALKTSADITESWVTAQNMLDSYHQRNLDQNNWTFRLSVIVMGVGCCIIFYGIQKAVGLGTHPSTSKGTNEGTTLIAILSTASGIVVNLIGGTFLAIYNSTLKQAIDYTNSLQKTSTVGTSLAILKSIEVANQTGVADPDTATKLIDAKIAIAKQLIGVPVGQ